VAGPGDTAALIGNTSVEREQREGLVELVLVGPALLLVGYGTNGVLDRQEGCFSEGALAVELRGTAGSPGARGVRPEVLSRLC
jgi:hypothetical protein